MCAIVYACPHSFAPCTPLANIYFVILCLCAGTLPQLLSGMGPKAEGTSHAFAHLAAGLVQPAAEADGPASVQLPVDGLKTSLATEQANTEPAANW